MEQMELYKGYRIRAYQEWRGQWFAEARNSTINRPETDYLATSSGHATPAAAIAVIKQMIDSPSTPIKAPRTIQ
jgi:pyridoxine/pyridoxamine 5'-phosphate oxidase